MPVAAARTLRKTTVVAFVSRVARFSWTDYRRSVNPVEMAWDLCFYFRENTYASRRQWAGCIQHRMFEKSDHLKSIRNVQAKWSTSSLRWFWGFTRWPLKSRRIRKQNSVRHRSFLRSSMMWWIHGQRQRSIKDLGYLKTVNKLLFVRKSHWFRYLRNVIYCFTKFGNTVPSFWVLSIR